MEEAGAVKAVFEDLGGYGALSRQGHSADGPLVGHLQRTNIQLAAIAVFAAKGLEDSTVNDVLEAAKVSRRTFYKYFSSKMDVLEGIYQTAVSLLLARFAEMQALAGSPQAWLQAMVARFFDYHLAVGPIIRLMQEEALRAGSPLSVHRQLAHQEMARLLAERLEHDARSTDVLMYRAVIWALESASLELLATEAKREQIDNAKRVLSDLAIATLCQRST